MKRVCITLTIMLVFGCQSETSDKEVHTTEDPVTTTPVVEEPKELELVWSDEFDGTTLDPDNWTFELGDGCPNLCGWGNNELQVYTDQNHRLEDGMLIVSAKKDAEGNYTSTRIITKGKREFQYGRIETRIKVATGTGLWPAFWALGNDIDTNSWPDCGEIDIMEYVGRKPGEVFTSVHTRSSFGNTINTQITPFPGIEDDFHVYAIEWNDAFIDFFLDENRVYRYAPQIQNQETWPFNKPFFLLINLAVGGNFGGAVSSSLEFPREYFIDYVRVYQ
ncbi:MAG: glycoside hydrolase family 16 protein [Flavobacteriaceae bacterium]